MSQQALTGEGACDLAARRDIVWAALLDPETLHALIAGSERVEQDGDRYTAWLSYGAGRIRARYRAELTILESAPPDALRLAGTSEGKLGWGRASAVVTLVEATPVTTTVTWRYDGVIGGPVALLGGTVLRTAARVFVGRFFAALGDRLTRLSEKSD